MEHNYDDIRPYHDDEVKGKVRLMLKDPAFDKVLMHLFKVRPKVEVVKMQLRMVRNTRQLQGGFVYDMLRRIINNTSDGLSCRGIEKLEKNKPYLFISNHRDIILDAALLNFLIFENGMNTTQIAIGDNLLLYDWIEHAVKLNRAFIIKRDLTPRELMKASRKVSRYIRKSIKEDRTSVWIAQREGRTKNGDDQTQLSVLKMLNMSNNESLPKGFNELNIVPLSISYEIEPCALAKMKELIKKEHYGQMKTSRDDLKSMSMGMFNPKGRIRFVFGDPVKIEESKESTAADKNAFIKQLGDKIDRQIHQNYKLWPNNYIAYDLLTEEKEFKNRYTAEDKKNFETMIQQAMIHIDFPITDIRERFLKMYANPVINKLNAEK